LNHALGFLWDAERGLEDEVSRAIRGADSAVEWMQLHLLFKHFLDNLERGGGGGDRVVGVERNDHQFLDPISLDLCEHLVYV
jgi:hypothetical protein